MPWTGIEDQSGLLFAGPALTKGQRLRAADDKILNKIRGAHEAIKTLVA